MRKSTLYIVAAFLLTFLLGVLLYNSIQLSRLNDAEPASERSNEEMIFAHWGYFPTELIGKFELEYPDISVDYQRYNMASYSEVMQKKLIMGEKVDVMGIAAQDLTGYVQQGYLQDLTGLGLLEYYRPGIREEVRNVTAGAEYAVPYQAQYFAVWYNKILFDKYNLKPPQDFGEFLNVCRILKRNDVQPLVLGARDETAATSILYLRVINVMNDDGWLDAFRSGQKSFLEGEAFQMIAQTQDMIDKGYISPDSINLTYQQAFDYFKNAKAAMLIAPDLSQNMAKEDFEKVCEPGVFAIPYADHADDVRVPVDALTKLIGISSRSTHATGASLFLEFISRPENVDIYCANTLSYPTVFKANTAVLPYENFWAPMRTRENLSLPFAHLPADDKKALGAAAQYFVAGLADSAEMAEVLQEIYIH